MAHTGDGGTSKGLTLWFTGLSGSGKSTVGGLLRDRLTSQGLPVEVLDGDEVRTHLSRGLGFSKEDRDTNIRRIGFVAKLLTRNGITTITAAISPYRAVRDMVRREIGSFVEIYVRCPLAVCAARDVKGLYKRALAGEIRNFTGVDDPYEEPLNPEVILDTHLETPAESVGKVLAFLEQAGYLKNTETLYGHYSGREVLG